MKYVFIGGTGRSGTTILSEIISKHQGVERFPIELRFITDPGGVVSLKHALVDDWSFFQSDIAISRFENLLDAVSTKYIGRYPNTYLKKLVGTKFYSEWKKSFVNSLVRFEFKGAWAARSNLARKIMMRLPLKKELISNFFETNYYSSPMNEEEFFELVSAHVKRYFDKYAENQNVGVVVEHTPSNNIHGEFIHKLLPESKLVHIFRNPFDVISSFSAKDWGAIDLEQNFIWICDTLRKWELEKAKIPNDFYTEIKFEDLIENNEDTVKSLCDFLSIDFSPSMLDIDLSRHNIGRWKNVISPTHAEQLRAKHAAGLDHYFGKTAIEDA